MKNKHFSRYYLFACLGVLTASLYPLYMGAKVVWDMIVNGTVMKEDYPKYIIPYTPICLALLVGILLLPLFIKLLKKYALIGGATISIGTFFGLEMLFEKNVVVTATETVTLGDWQMFMCYVPPEGWNETITTYKTQTPVDILMGNYNPAFKLHFYMISVVLILSFLNCLYGFAQIIKFEETRRIKVLILQSVSALIFLGLCILACFTAFGRDGNILVSPLSATLMSVFFILLGVTVGIFVGSFLIGRKKRATVWIPSIISSLMTLLMYIGEMILLHGHLYQYGTGFFFQPLPVIVLAPIDICIVLISGGISAGIFYQLNKTEQ